MMRHNVLWWKVLLDLLKRPTDPPEYYEYYGIPVAAFAGGYAFSSLAGFKEASAIAASISALCCIGGIAGLSTQKTARLGNISGMAGVSFGLASAIVVKSVGPPPQNPR